MKRKPNFRNRFLYACSSYGHSFEEVGNYLVCVKCGFNIIKCNIKKQEEKNDR